MENCYDNFYCFMTLLVAHKHFKPEILPTSGNEDEERAFKFLYKLIDAPEYVGRAIFAIHHDEDKYDEVIAPNRTLWGIYLKEGEEALRGILDMLDTMREDF